MATFTGTKTLSLVQIALDPYTSANLFIDRAYYTGDTLPANDTIGTVRAGAISRPYTGPQVAPGKTGTKSRYFIDDWYYRIHIMPGVVDLGNLVSSQSRDVVLWNAYLSPVTFSEFSYTGFDGITLTPPTGLSPPTQLKALGLYTYQLAVSTSGPPTIDASMSWTIDGTVYTVPVSGRRVVAFAFPPNWDRGVQETIEFKSTVIQSHDGSEQRASLRARGRRSFEYTTLLQKVEQQRVDSLLFGWQSRLFALPCWPEESRLVSAVAAGNSVLTLDTTYRSFVVGGLVAVYASPSDVEIREISEVTSENVTLAAPLAKDWPADTRVYPAFVAAANATMSGRRLTDRVLELPVRFVCEPSVTPDNASGAADGTYQGAELSLSRVNWANAQTVEWNADYSMLDQGTGKFSLLPRAGFSQITKAHDWVLQGYQQVSNFRGWLSRRSGRAVSVYVPSGFDDFNLAADALASDTGIDCRQNDYENQAAGNPARRDILIQFRDGTSLARRIFSAATTEDGFTRLVFTEALGRDITISDVRRISYLGLYRLGSDSITLNWMTRKVVTASTTLVNTTG